MRSTAEAFGHGGGIGIIADLDGKTEGIGKECG